MEYIESSEGCRIVSNGLLLWYCQNHGKRIWSSDFRFQIGVVFYRRLLTQSPIDNSTDMTVDLMIIEIFNGICKIAVHQLGLV